ncbi:cupin domain protein [Stagonosporopsis vannaccii]|nr:cupin domain protein [Stagonosporopsis vannaccii]
MGIMWPEQYTLASSQFVPNNVFPALIYRGALPIPVDQELAENICERNGWEKRGEWGEIRIPHFHPNTHECYAIIRGESRLALGRAKENKGTDGIEVDVGVGDVIVIPAGVSHRSLRSKGGFRYIGVYPKEAPRWRNNHCNGEESMDALAKEINNVPVPKYDPLFGENGPLCQTWKSKLVEVRAKI